MEGAAQRLESLRRQIRKLQAAPRTYLAVLKTGIAEFDSWIAGGGFSDTGAPCRWRDNSPKLVDCQLYEKSFPAGSHVSLATTNIDYVVLMK